MYKERTKRNTFRDIAAILLFAIIFICVNPEWDIMIINYPLSNTLLLISFAICIVFFPGKANVFFRKDVLIFFAITSYIFLNSVLKDSPDSYKIFYRLLLFYQIIYLATIYNNFRGILKFFVAAVLVMVLVGCFEFVAGHTLYARIWQKGERYTEIGTLAIGSTVASGNYISLGLLPAIPILFYLRRTATTYKVFFTLTIAFLIIFMIALFSRTGLLMLIACLVLVFNINKINKVNGMAAFYIFMGLVTFYLYIVIRGGGYSAMFLEDMQKDKSLAYRAQVLFILGVSFLKDPLFGIGYHQFKLTSLDLLRQYTGIKNDIDTAPMNTYFGAIAELGLVGGVILFFYYRYYVKLVFDVRLPFNLKTDKTKSASMYLFISIFIIVLNSFIIDALFNPTVVVVTALIGISYQNDINQTIVVVQQQQPVEG